jgi:serine/threonine protein kinase
MYEGEYNSKVDVFSFAMVLYEILVGRAVYADCSDERTRYLAITRTRAELPPEMSSDVKSLVTRCWSGDPDSRPSFSDIQRDLERLEFKIVPGVDSAAVKQFLSDIRLQRANQESLTQF